MKGVLGSAGLLLCSLLAAQGRVLTDGECLDCHGDPGLRTGREGRAISLYVDRQVLAQSAHASIACADCHALARGLPHGERLAPVDCSPCHPAQVAGYSHSVHGLKREAGNAAAPGCASCHGTHGTQSLADSSLAHRNEVAAICGQCHAPIAATYRESVHGQAVASGIPEAPLCTDCHGEHTIAAPWDPASRVAPRNIPKTCAACHEEERIAGKYGMPMRRYATYLDSYHGVVNRYGERAVANCASCHGVHDIRPSSDPASSIHPANLGKTCGACHPGAERGLVGAKVHVEATPESSKGIYYVRRFYTYFIGLLMLCFVAYIAIDIWGSLRRREGR